LSWTYWNSKNVAYRNQYWICSPVCSAWSVVEVIVVTATRIVGNRGARIDESIVSIETAYNISCIVVKSRGTVASCYCYWRCRRLIELLNFWCCESSVVDLGFIYCSVSSVSSSTDCEIAFTFSEAYYFFIGFVTDLFHYSCIVFYSVRDSI
jgi:hypothetical protein